MSDPHINVLSGKRLVIVRQSEVTECGLCCLAMIAAFYGYETDLANLRRRFPASLKGATVKTLIGVASALQLSARALRCEPSDLAKLQLPAILHWNMNHFVVLDSVGRTGARIFDPSTGVRSVSPNELSQRFTGVAIELTPAEAFRPKRDRLLAKLGTLISSRSIMAGGLLQALSLTLLGELLLLALPFYLQTTIDQALPRADFDLLAVLAISFGTIALLHAVSVLFRGLSLQMLGARISYEIQLRLIHHLLRLPLEWFHKRQIGDIQSRLKAFEPIRQFLSGNAISAIFDGVFGVLIGTVLFILSPILASIVIAAAFLILIVRLATLDVSRRVAGDVLITDAREQTRLLETLRAMQTIKLSASEPERGSLQRNAMAAALNATVRSGNVTLTATAIVQAISALADVVIVYLGATAVMNVTLTLGTLTAFLAFKAQFLTRATGLVGSIVSWRLLDLQLERLSDIILHPREKSVDEPGHDGRLIGAIELRSVYFRYGFGEEDILRGVSMRVEPGESVAIVGPSGVGKSTLLRVLLGLYRPTSGEIFYDGRPLSAWNQRALRQQIGVVMQDDMLLAGSIAENIAGFSESIDMARVEAAARASCVHGEITRMPMGYQALVGDMGSALSGGQKQRVMIARALYARPRILVLDEGTAHLDVETEQAINEALTKLAITRVIVAHRPETIRSAQRTVELRGSIVPRRPSAVAPVNPTSAPVTPQQPAQAV